jgi:hypothetical protein
MSCCAIILSYKREQNIPIIVDTLLAMDDVDHVIVSNNNPDVDLSVLLSNKLECFKFELIQQDCRCHCIKRFEIAIDLDYDYFICIDDDVFLTQNQIQFLLDSVKANPLVPHGFNGQLECFEQDCLFLHGGVGFENHPIDVLNNGYFFTKKHAVKMFFLASELGIDAMSDAVFIDDVLLSFSGEGKPICHYIGEIKTCPSSELTGIATYKENNFDAIRMDAYLKLKAIAPRNRQE